MPNTPLSIRKKSTITTDTFEKPALVNKMSSLPNRPILSPETTKILESAEKLVENVEKKIVEINHDILFHKENLEMPASQPTIDEDLLHLRQLVASKFQQANNPSKAHNVNDHTIFTNSVLQVPEKEINEVPRLLKLLTMIPERCCLETGNEESCYKTVPSYVPNRLQTNVQDQNESSTNKNEKAAQTDEKENQPESSTFQIQTGPRVIIKRSLQVQNVECLHISPGSSINEQTNVGIYHFQHKTSSERNDINQDHIIESNQEDNTYLEEKTVEKKQMFRKSVVLKNPHDLKLSFRNDSKKMVEKPLETNNVSRDKELSSQSPRETIQGNSTKSPEPCNIENSKAKAFSEFLISLEKDLDYSNASNEVEDSGDIKTPFETLDSDKKFQLEKVKEILIEGHSNDELKNSGCGSGKLPNKPTIISNERVNLNYKYFLSNNVVNPIISKSFCQMDKNSEDSKVEIDDINLKEPFIFDLDTVLKRNDEIINNVVQGSDEFFKIISSKLKAYNNFINQENKKVDQNVKLASVIKSKSQEEMKKSSIKKFSEEKEKDFKLYKASDNILDDIISGTNTFSKFISARSEINDSVINQESVLNTHSINLSSASLSLISSTKNPVSQKPLSSHMKKSSSLSSVSSNDQYNSESNDFNIKNFSEERNIKLSVPSSERSSKDNFEERIEKKNKKINEEEKSVQIVLMHNKFDNFETKEGKEFPKSFRNQSSNTDEIEEDDANWKAFASKPLSNADLSFNNHNINYSEPPLERKENDFNEMEIFGHIFESLRHSSAAMKRFITCLFGETEARIENEIIGILRETSVHPTIINKFLLILQRRDKNSQLPIFTTNIGLYLNLSDDSRDSFTLRKQFTDFLQGGRLVSLESESNRKLSNDQSSSNDQSNKNENNDKISTEIRLEFDVTTVDKKNLSSDSMQVVTEKEIDLTKSQEENKELLEKRSNGIFSLENQSKVEKVLNATNEKQLIDETDKKSSDNSLKNVQEINKNLNKVEIKSNSTNSSLDIKLVESVQSVSESSKRIDYSQNFTDSSSTSKDCKSLESHVSLKLSDSFMNKKEGNKETIAERSDELDIQKKIDDLLNKEQRVALSVEKSIRTEIDNLSKERSSEENVKRKSLIRGKTFIIKKNSDLDLNTKIPEGRCSDVNSSLSDSQKGSNVKVPSIASGSSERNVESSSETYSEGEVHLPSSCSYSLGEIRLSEQEKLRLGTPVEDTNNSKTVYSCKKKNSGSSSCMSNSLTRSLGEV